MPKQTVEPEELRVLDDALRVVVKTLIAQGNSHEEILYVLTWHLTHKVSDIVIEETT